MTIKELCYELYKIDWKQNHGITLKFEEENLIDYFEGYHLLEFDEDYTYNQFIEDYGYQGILYVCYDEFLDNEYTDKDYIKSLLPEALYQKYLKDIEEDN